VPSPDLRGGERFAHECYADAVRAALAEREALPPHADAHGDTCADCGPSVRRQQKRGGDGSDGCGGGGSGGGHSNDDDEEEEEEDVERSVAACAAVAGRNLCFSCLDKTFLPRLAVMSKFHDACLFSPTAPHLSCVIVRTANGVHAVVECQAECQEPLVLAVASVSARNAQESLRASLAVVH
jgi:hypothetical protein